jgi:hypothetical protein
MNIRMRLCVTTLTAIAALIAACDSIQAHSISGPITRPSAGVGAESGHRRCHEHQHTAGGSIRHTATDPTTDPTTDRAGD